MGTSGDYPAPSSSGWPDLKRQVTAFGKEGSGSGIPPQQLLSGYVSACGGPERLAGGGPGSATSGRSPRAVGRSLGGFLSNVASVGLTETLRRIGLGELVGRPAGDLRAALLDYLAGPGSTIDEAALRRALSELERELLASAQTYEDAEAALSEALTRDGVVRILMRFFALYLFERFCRDFYAHLLERVGKQRAARALANVKAYIMSCLRARTARKDVTAIDWAGTEGERLAYAVLQETLDVFEVAT